MLRRLCVAAMMVLCKMAPVLNQPPGSAVFVKMNATVAMDQHTLELLEFTKVRELLAGHAASSLGKELARQAAIGSMLSAEELLQVADTLSCTGAMYRYRMSLDARFQRLINLLTPIEDMGVVAKAITGCIDSRGHLLDMASTELARIRQQLAELED